jgi:hypothetical protein
MGCVFLHVVGSPSQKKSSPTRRFEKRPEPRVTKKASRFPLPASRSIPICSTPGRTGTRCGAGSARRTYPSPRPSGDQPLPLQRPSPSRPRWSAPLPLAATKPSNHGSLVPFCLATEPSNRGSLLPFRPATKPSNRGGLLPSSRQPSPPTAAACSPSI